MDVKKVVVSVVVLVAWSVVLKDGMLVVWKAVLRVA